MVAVVCAGITSRIQKRKRKRYRSGGNKGLKWGDQNMGVSVRLKDGNWYIFIRHAGERAAQKCVDQQHAEDTQKAVLTAIAAGQFDIAALRKKPDQSKERRP